MALRDFVKDTAEYSRIWLQTIPEKYVAGEMIIRYVGDTSVDETGYHYRLDRDYQIVYFGDSELDCLQKASAIQRKVNNHKQVRLEDSGRYMTLESFSFSQPTKAEGGDVYFIIGILQARVRQARDFSQEEKMWEINIDVRKEGD